MDMDPRGLSAALGASPQEALALWGVEPDKPETKAVDAEEEPRPTEYRRHLTLAVITNEADAPKLGRLLKGCAEHFGTIVVVDTSPELSAAVVEVVAEHHGASVHHFPWCDNFAAARNEALRFCPSKGWLFFLDSDEQLAVQSPKVLRWLAIRADADHKAKGRPAPDAWRLAMLNESDRGSVMIQLTRVFRLGHTSLRYESRLHEYVAGTRDNSMVMGGTLPALVLGHDGYKLDEAGMLAKSLRNERLADLQLEDAPEEPHSWFLVGTCSNDPERAFNHLRRLAEWAKEHPLQAKMQGWIREGLVRGAMRQGELALSLTSVGSPALDLMGKKAWRKAEVMCAAARSLLPGLPHTLSDLGEADLRFLHARCKFALGDPAGAYDVLLPTMGHKGVSWLSPDAAYVERFWLWARLLIELHEYAQAIAVIDQTLASADANLTTMAAKYRERLAPLRLMAEREQEAWKGQVLAVLRPDQLAEVLTGEVDHAEA